MDKYINYLTEMKKKTTIDDKIVDTAKQLKKEYRKNLITGLNAGLAFLIALTIRDLLSLGLNYFLIKLNLQNAQGFIYGITSTLLIVMVCVVAMMIISKWEVKDE